MLYDCGAAMCTVAPVPAEHTALRLCTPALQSSTIFAIAGHFNLPVCCVDFGASQMTDKTLNRLLNSAPNPCVLLFEVSQAQRARNAAMRRGADSSVRRFDGWRVFPGNRHRVSPQVRRSGYVSAPAVGTWDAL